MKKEQKVSLVNEFKDLLGKSSVMVVSDYRGLNVEKITALRSNVRKSGAALRVIKNTLAKKAIPGTPFAGADPLFEGPTAVTIGQGDPVNVIKVLTAFSKENELFKIRGGIVEGGTFSAAEIFRIATLPPREALLAKMVGSLNSPLARMVGSLGSPVRGLLGVLQAIKARKDAH